MTEEDLEKLVLENGYVAGRFLPDGSVALLVDLAFTRAICLGATLDSSYTTNRFCFENRACATCEFSLLESKDDVPEGYIARRPEVRDEKGNYL